MIQKCHFPNVPGAFPYFPWLISEVKLPVHFFQTRCSVSLSCLVMYVLVCLLFLTGGLKPETKMLLSAASKKKSKAGKGDANKEDESSKNDSAQPVTITLLFKRK